MRKEIAVKTTEYKLLEPVTTTKGIWRFRNNLLDDSENGNHLELIGFDKYMPGSTEPGFTGIKLNGEAGQGMKRRASSATDFDFGSGSFTVEIIFSVKGTTSNTLVNKKGATNTAGLWLVFFSQSLMFIVNDGTNNVNCMSAQSWSNPQSEDSFHHLAIVVDRVADRVYMYVDGVEDTNSGWSIATIGSVSNSNADLEIGKGFEGIIDEICISGEIISAPVIALRSAGYTDGSFGDPGYIKKFLPGMHDGNDSLDRFLKPFDFIYQGLQKRFSDIKQLPLWDQTPERFLPHLASLFNFELIDPSVSTISERRLFFKWMFWLFQNKGTKACVDKFIELLGFTNTSVDKYPDRSPYIMNHYRIYDIDNVSDIRFEDSFDENLSKWDRPLNYDTIWRLGSGSLYAKSTTQDDQNNAILFDDTDKVFYIEAEIKLVDADGDHQNWGFYIAYEDENNWIQLGRYQSGSEVFGITYRYNGGSQVFHILKNLSTAGFNAVDGQTYKIWFYVDLTNNIFTGGIDGNSYMLKEQYGIPNIEPIKKGIWTDGADCEVEWNSFKLRDIRYDLAPVIFDESLLDRRLEIVLTGYPANAQAKEFYLQKVLPRYIPFGVRLVWGSLLTASTVSCVADSILSFIGDIFSGAKGSSASCVADGAVGTQGSITIDAGSAVVSHCVAIFFVNIVFGYGVTATTDADKLYVGTLLPVTPAAATATTARDFTFALTDTSFDGSGVNAANSDARTLGVCYCFPLIPLATDGFYSLDSDPSVTTIIAASGIYDDNFSVVASPSQGVDGLNMVIEYMGDIFIAKIILHDLYSTQADGMLYEDNTRRIELWRKDHISNPDNDKYTKKMTIYADEFYRRGQEIHLNFCHDRFSILRNGGNNGKAGLLVHFPNALQAPDGTALQFSEMIVHNYYVSS